MKTLRMALAAAGLIAAFSLRAATAGPAPRVEIVFDHPENFTDVKDSYSGTDKGRDAILGQIRDFIVRKATPMIPEGYRLTLTFTDIDLAGEYEPWRGPQWDGVRIVKGIYPPAFKFAYSVTDSTGKVVKKGSEFIRDLGFEFRSVLDRSDALHYEKEVLSDWLRSNLSGIRKA